MSKLEREIDQLAAEMTDMSAKIEAFSKRKIPTLPGGTAWTLLRASLAIISAASKVQLRAVKETAKGMKKQLAATTTAAR